MFGTARNIAIYPWFRFLRGLVFRQAVRFLYFQRFAEPPQAGVDFAERAELPRFSSLISALASPVLVRLFMLSILMYMFSHIPFVFGQPFIPEALGGSVPAGKAGLVSGLVWALTMVLSVIATLFAASCVLARFSRRRGG